MTTYDSMSMTLSLQPCHYDSKGSIMIQTAGGGSKQQGPIWNLVAAAGGGREDRLVP